MHIGEIKPLNCLLGISRPRNSSGERHEDQGTPHLASSGWSVTYFLTIFFGLSKTLKVNSRTPPSSLGGSVGFFNAGQQVGEGQDTLTTHSANPRPAPYEGSRS